MNRTILSAALCISGYAVTPHVRAQEASTPPKEFEVASIKPNTTGGHAVKIRMEPGGRFVAENVTVKILIQQAYGVKDFQIIGAPGWISTERYDVNAKSEGEISMTAIMPLLQALLADRFKMQMHRDTKELPMYALVVGKNGPKLKESAEVPKSDSVDKAITPPSPGMGTRAMVRMGRGLINGQQVPMTMFANQLSQQLGRSVTDKTGLTGRYDVKLEWTPDEGQGGPREGGSEAAAPIDSSGPSIFTALQDQLGLKLESQKGPVEIIAIDHIEKATEN